MVNKASITVSFSGFVKRALDSGTLASMIISMSAGRLSTHPEGSTRPLEGMARLALVTQKRPLEGLDNFTL